MGSNTSGEGSPDTQAVLDAVRRIVQALRESSRAAERRVGLTGAQLFVLQTIAAHPGISVNALAARTRTHQSSVSTVVSRLVSRGLIRRTRSARDGRTLELSLSAGGNRAAGRMPDATQGQLIAAIDHLSDRRRHQLASLLTEVVEGMDVGSGAAPMFFEERSRRSWKRGDDV